MKLAAYCCAAIAKAMLAWPAFWTTTRSFDRRMLDLYEADFDTRHMAVCRSRLTERQIGAVRGSREGAIFQHSRGRPRTWFCA